jgi:transcriptional regulator with XRE-family HTH domain
MALRRVPCVSPDAAKELRVLAELVRAKRVERGLTQEAVALEGGVGRKYPGQLERGELVPKWPTVVGVVRGLGMSPAEFFFAYAERLENT